VNYDLQAPISGKIEKCTQNIEECTEDRTQHYTYKKGPQQNSPRGQNTPPTNQRLAHGFKGLSGRANGCHTLKYLILGCEYLLECVRPSLGFLENFPDFSKIILFFRRAKSIYWKALKSFFGLRVFYLDSSCPRFFIEIFWILQDIFFMV
jgi:hypothetical protein